MSSARCRFVLDRDRQRFSGLDEAFHEFGMVASTVRDARPLAEEDFSVLFVIDPRGIGRVGHIKDDGVIWAEAVGGHACAMATDFFLDSIESDDRSIVESRGREIVEDFCDEVASDTVIETSADDAARREELRRFLDDGRATDMETQIGDFFRGRSTNIDEEVVPFREFVFIFFAEVDSGIAHDADDLAVRAEKAQATGGRDRAVRATDGGDIDKALVIDMADNEADFVGVRFEHEGERIGFFSAEDGPSVSVGIRIDDIAKGRDLVFPAILRFGFPSGRACSGEEFE